MQEQVKIPQRELSPSEAAARHRALLVRIVRMAFFVLILTFTMLAILQARDNEIAEGLAIVWYVPLSVGLLVFGAALAIDIYTPNKKLSALSGVFFGVIAGMLATVALGFVVDLLLESWVAQPKALEQLKPIVNNVKILIGISMCYLGVSTVLQTQDDFRLVIPYVEFAKQLRGTRPLLIDTSVLIDGRIIDVAATNFLLAPIIIPRFVLAELQLLADSGDTLQRAKGRRGLDMVFRLQRSPKLDVSIDDSAVPGKSVDQMLIMLAKDMPAVVVTTDFALARAAEIQGVTTLNLNDLANAMKPSFIPGQSITVRLVRPGEQPGQAVGYLADGTMIIAENGFSHIGEDAHLTVSTVMQTSAGRLVFARLAVEDRAPDLTPTPNPTPTPTPAPSPAPAPADPPTLSATPADASAAGAPDAPASPAHLGPTVVTPAQSQGPFPPKQPSRWVRGGTPRNPRR